VSHLNNPILLIIVQLQRDDESGVEVDHFNLPIAPPLGRVPLGGGAPNGGAAIPFLAGRKGCPKGSCTSIAQW
jgi:hypothetical protein